MYIALINVHGLVRSDNIEMGRDADTGGQTRYVVDLVKELSSREDVEVDLFTRLIKDSRTSEDYRKSIEQIGEHARIVRLTCGGTKYLRKELLWPYLDEFVDNLISFFSVHKREPQTSFMPTMRMLAMLLQSWLHTSKFLWYSPATQWDATNLNIS